MRNLRAGPGTLGRRGASLLALVVAAACTSMSQTSGGAYATSVQRALEYLPDGETLDWVDPETEATSRVTVLATTQDAAARYCRTVKVEPDVAAAPAEGPAEDEALTYCRDPESGAWEPNDPTPP